MNINKTQNKKISETCSCGNNNCEYKEGVLHWHEALDRSHVACDQFSGYIQNHPAILHNKELKDAARKVVETMQDFYQLVGRKSYEFDLVTGKVYDNAHRRQPHSNT